MEIPVIIPVFNCPEYTQSCLDSIFETDHGYPILPIIVDNGSRNKTKKIIQQYIEEKYPSLNNIYVKKPQVITLKKNGGFSIAINEGLKVALEHSGNDPIVILHNDTIVFNGWVKELMDCLLAEDEEVIAIMPKTNYANEHLVCIQEIRDKFLEIKPHNKERISIDDINGLISKLYPEGKESFIKKIKNKSYIKTTYSSEISSFCIMIKKIF